MTPDVNEFLSPERIDYSKFFTFNIFSQHLNNGDLYFGLLLRRLCQEQSHFCFGHRLTFNRGTIQMNHAKQTNLIN